MVISLLHLLTYEPIHSESLPHTLHREKRFLWITDDGSLTLPAGSCFEVVPTFTTPLWVSPDTAICVNFSVSLPFDSKFVILYRMFTFSSSVILCSKNV